MRGRLRAEAAAGEARAMAEAVVQAAVEAAQAMMAASRESMPPPREEGGVAPREMAEAKVAEEMVGQDDACMAGAAGVAVAASATPPWPGSATYKVGRLLGKGTYGSVYEAVHRKTGEPVAIKCIDGVFSGREVTTMTLRELWLHVHVDVAGGRGSVARLVDIVPPEDGDDTYDRVFAVFERFDESLAETMGRQRDWASTTSDERRRIAYDLVSCVARLHAVGVAHRDIKPQNVLLKGGRQRVVLCDLGMARKVVRRGGGGTRNETEDEDTSMWTDYVTTRWYRSPEVCCAVRGEGSAAMAADIWSLACVLCEVLGDRPDAIFRGSSTERQLHLVGEALGPLCDADRAFYLDRGTDAKAVDSMLKGAEARREATARSIAATLLVLRRIPRQACDMLLKMLTYDPNVRLSAAAALDHPFFQGLQRQASLPVDNDDADLVTMDAWFERDATAGQEAPVTAREQLHRDRRVVTDEVRLCRNRLSVALAESLAVA